MTASPPPASTVMVVDDTPANLLLLEEILTGGGYRVSAFPSGELALEAIRHAAPDLLLLDIMMPGLDGYAVCERLKADSALQSIPVIFISALSQASEKVRALAAGGVDYVTKPFFADEVIARVAVHLDLQARRREVEHQRRDLARVNARLRELEGQRDTLVHMVAHDMKSPLSAIIMAVSMLQELLPKFAEADPTRRDAGGRLLHSMSRASRHLRDMIETLVDVSRLEQAAMPLQLARHDVRELVARAVALQGPRLPAEVFTHVVPAEPVEAICDADLVGRVLQNLLDNAINHAGGQARIGLEVECRSGEVCLRVTDNGRGIPAEARKRIFEKFGQVGAGEKHGSGLGLTFCKLAVEAQGGTIGVDSVPGQGSTFWFTLPVPA